MSKVRYVGPHADGVVIDVLGVEVEHQGVIDVPDEIAASLLEQVGNWASVADAPKKAEKADDPEEG